MSRHVTPRMLTCSSFERTCTSFTWFPGSRTCLRQGINEGMGIVAHRSSAPTSPTMSQAATTLSTILPIPTGTWDKNFGHLHIKVCLSQCPSQRSLIMGTQDDILYPKGQTPYVGRDLQVRAGLFVISQVAPVLAAALITFSKKGWWERKLCVVAFCFDHLL